MITQEHVSMCCALCGFFVFPSECQSAYLDMIITIPFQLGIAFIIHKELKGEKLLNVSLEGLGSVSFNAAC